QPENYRAVPTEHHVATADLQSDGLRRAHGDLLRVVRQLDGDAFRAEVNVRPPLVVGRDALHRTDDPIADDQGADVHAGIRDVLLEAHDFAEELQRVDDRRGLLEAHHAPHADPLPAAEDLQDGRIPEEMRGLPEVRPRREEDAPWAREVRLATRLP